MKIANLVVFDSLAPVFDSLAQYMYEGVLACHNAKWSNQGLQYLTCSQNFIKHSLNSTSRLVKFKVIEPVTENCMITQEFHRTLCLACCAMSQRDAYILYTAKPENTIARKAITTVLILINLPPPTPTPTPAPNLF